MAECITLIGEAKATAEERLRAAIFEARHGAIHGRVSRKDVAWLWQWRRTLQAGLHHVRKTPNVPDMADRVAAVLNIGGSTWPVDRATAQSERAH